MLHLVQSGYKFGKMRLECEGITDVINKYYGVEKEHWSYIELSECNALLNPNYLLFNVRVPGTSAGYIKCDEHGIIVDAKYDIDICRDNYLFNRFNLLINSKFDENDIEKIKNQICLEKI